MGLEPQAHNPLHTAQGVALDTRLKELLKTPHIQHRAEGETVFSDRFEGSCPAICPCCQLALLQRNVTYFEQNATSTKSTRTRAEGGLYI